MYSWWWVRLSPETCRVKAIAKNKNATVASCWTYFTYYGVNSFKNSIHTWQTFLWLLYIYRLEQSAYPPMHVICLHNGVVFFFASEPSSDWVNLSLLQGPLLYKWDALLQLRQVVSILKQCSVLVAQDIKMVGVWDILLRTVVRRNKESGGPCCFHPHFSQKDHHELLWRKGWQWQAHPKRWLPEINLHSIISQNLLTSLSFISFKRFSYVPYPGLTLWHILDVIKTHSLYMFFTVSSILMYTI